MTHPDRDTATIERELEAVEDALRAGAADHQDPSSGSFRTWRSLLQAEASEPDAEFAEALEQRMGRDSRRSRDRPARGGRVRAGLAAAVAWPRNAVRRLRPRRMLPAAAAVVTSS